MSSVSTTSMARALENDKKYHCSILYNYHQGPSDSRDLDHRKSLSFVKFLDKVLKNKGFKENYYYDKCLLGTDLFGMLSEMITWSEKIVVVFTRGFISNCWHKHSDQTALKSLIDNEEQHRLVLIAIGLEKNNLPIDLGVPPKMVIYFNDNWKEDKAAWNRLLRRFTQKTQASERDNLPPPRRTLNIQDIDDLSDDSDDGSLTSVMHLNDQEGTLLEDTAVVNRSCEKVFDEPSGCEENRCKDGGNGSWRLPIYVIVLILSCFILLISVLAMQLYRTFIRT